MKATLGLTGLTVNAMALIAPGAFLWLTYQIQAAYGAPMAGSDMWFGIVAALALCFATAVSYAELSKLYPGAVSSYFFAEQAFLCKTHAFKFARIAKFIIGWASHLYYWVYPGLMVGVTAILVGYMAGDLLPSVFSSGVASPVLMIGFCVVFAVGVGYIAYRGANTSTGVNIAVNVVQISALLVFAIIAIAYRCNHPQDSNYWTLDPDGNATKYQLATFAVGADSNVGTFKAESDGTVNQYVVEDDGKGNPKKDDKGAYVFKKDDKGNLIPALTYKVEVDETHKRAAEENLFPKVDKDGNWVFSKDKDGKKIPAETYKVDGDKKDKYGAPLFVYVNDKAVPDPKGQNLPSDQQDPNDHAAYYPDEKGVYVVDSTSAGKSLAVTDADKSKEKAETNYYLVVNDKGQPIPTDKDHQPALLKADYGAALLTADPYHPKQADTRQWFSDGVDVIKPHGFSFVFIQACIAILILVGFESVTSMGEEAKNPKKHIPWAILLSLAIQGGFCYLVEYFAAGYFLHPGYTLTTAAGATAPIGDMMKISGAWLFGSAAGGEWFMRIEALTVFLALIGTTLACLNTGARVTYAMGRDDEVPSHFGMLHGKNLTPHRAIWTLVGLSAVIGVVTVIGYLCGPSANAANDALMDAAPVKGSFWYPSFLLFKSTGLGAWIPNSLITVTLISNFGTFLLYMLSCMIAIVAFREHHMFNGIKHMVIPIFGLIANLICMLFYLVAPLPVPGIGVSGMSWHEPYTALLFVAFWGGYGWFYFVASSKKKGKSILVASPPIPNSAAAGKEAFSSPH
jgi:amino acid transporter